MAKRIRISALGADTFTTLPGNSAELRNENGELNDTIFGQDFQSTESGIGMWTISSNALYKGFAGYVVDIKKGGVPTAFTDEAASLVSGKTYQIDDAIKQIWDVSVPVTIEDNAVAVAAANIESIDYLNGKVTFIAAYVPTGPITVSGTYLPTSSVAGYRTFTLSLTSEAIDETDIPTAKANGGFRVFNAEGLKTVGLELSGIYKKTNGFIAALKAREPLYVEINPDGEGNTVARGIFKYTSQSQSGDVGALEEENLSLGLSVPDNDMLAAPFTWVDTAASTLNVGIRECISAWLNKTLVDVQYLPDGLTGHEGSAVITDLTLTGGLEAMNEFSVNLQGSGEPTEVV